MTTIAITEETRDKFKEFKRYLGRRLNDDKFLDFLIESNPKYLEFIEKSRLEKWKAEWFEQNKEELREPFSEFHKRKIREELKNG